MTWLCRSAHAIRATGSRANVHIIRQAEKAASDERHNLVIFDKDGTLIEFEPMWTPWVIGMTERMELVSGLKNVGLSKKVCESIGFCLDTKTVKSGLLAEAPMPEVKAKMAEVLADHGHPIDEATEILNMIWEECDTTSCETLRMYGDLHHLFNQLKSHNFKIAVSTADTRKGTMAGLEKLDLLKYLDMIVCGDDDWVSQHPKPHAENALRICRSLGACPTKTMVVGDTLADVEMGRNAKLFKTIGVLSGVATADDLSPHTDHLIPDVGHILPLIRDHYKLPE